MPCLYEITFLPAGTVNKFAGSRGNYYEFEDGSTLDMQTTPAWCRACSRIVHGERIESLDEIGQQFIDLHDPKSELYRFTQKSLLPEFDDIMSPPEEFRCRLIEETEKRRRWRESRQSAPRCIDCGSTNIFIFPFDEEAPNPDGPGTVKLSTIGMCSTDFNEWFFTPEGERIARNTTPKYWHHPLLDHNNDGLKSLFKEIMRKADSKNEQRS